MMSDVFDEITTLLEAELDQWRADEPISISLCPFRATILHEELSGKSPDDLNAWVILSALGIDHERRETKSLAQELARAIDDYDSPESRASLRRVLEEALALIDAKQGIA